MLLLCFCLRLPAEDGGWGAATGKYLYTPPQTVSGGGIKGKIVNPDRPLAGAFALPPDDPKAVFRGAVSGAKNSEFSFAGLPDGRYDLLLAFDDAFYEGLSLHRGEDTLTPRDRELIEAIVSKSEPFYNQKVICRLEGETGKMTGKARCICTFFRSKASVDYTWAGTQGYHAEHRRSLKLVLLEDVGPGWQVARTREVFTVMVKPGAGPGRHEYRKRLGLVRVAGEMKDLGDIDLSEKDL